MDEALLKKLRYKEGRAVILGAPPGYAPGLELGDAPSGEYDFVQLFVRDAAEVAAKLPTVIAHLKPDAVFWLTYPKQSSKVKTDINRDTLAAQVQVLTAPPHPSKHAATSANDLTRQVPPGAPKRA